MCKQSDIEKDIKKFHKKNYKKVMEAENDIERESRFDQFKQGMNKLLIETRENRRMPKQKRGMTETVYSRWYRPPEIILLDHNYN